MNTARNRTQVKLRLDEIGTYALTAITLFEGRTESIPVLFTWDGRPPAGSALFLGQAVGRSSDTSIGSVPQRVDDFEVQCQLYIDACPSPDLAELAAETALNAIEAVLRRLDRLVDPLGEVPTANPPASSSQPAPWDVDFAHISELTGPYHPVQQPVAPGLSAPTPTSWSGVADFTISCRTSLA